MSDRQPFFSIGVTAFDRAEFLSAAVASIRRQTFGDFEVIIGNDCPTAPVSLDALGATGDPRIRVINHPQNLGEVRNMNALLASARGRHFTWLADDDAYAPCFLEAVHAALMAHRVRCVFTSYTRDAEAAVEGGQLPRARMLSGGQFVSGLLDKSIPALGCYGVFEAAYLRSLGGMEQLGIGFSPYSDMLLALRTGRLDQIAYIDAPLILFRAHPGSQSATSVDLAAYHTAQEDFCAKSLPVLRAVAMNTADFERNLFQLLSYYCVSYYCTVARRGGSVRLPDTWRYARFVAGYGRLLGSRRNEFADELGKTLRSLLLWVFVARAREAWRALRARVPAFR